MPYVQPLTPIRESWKKIQKPGTELASFLEKKSKQKSKNRILGTSGSVIFGKKIQTFFMSTWS